MKNLLLVSIILLTFIHVSCASFPVADTLKVKQDIFQTEEIQQYHSSLIKMGIDLNDCRCESCRKSNKFLKENTMHQGVTGLYILSVLILLSVIIWFSIGLMQMYNCVDTRSNCPQSSGTTRKGMPIELLWMGLLVLISAGIAIKARFVQMKNKRSVLKNN